MVYNVHSNRNIEEHKSHLNFSQPCCDNMKGFSSSSSLFSLFIEFDGNSKDGFRFAMCVY